MHGGGAERRSYQHSRLACYTRSRARLSAACPAQLLCGQAARPGLSSPGRQAATCPWMFQSGRRRLLLLVALRMIQSRASDLLSPVNARIVLRPFLLVLLQMIQSWALLGLVPALLHYHGLVRVLASVHHHGLLLLAAALLLHGVVLLAAAPLRLGLGLLFTSLHHHGLFLPMVALPLRGLVLISASLLYPGLNLTVASLHDPGLIHWSASLLHHCPVFIFAALRRSASSTSLPPCISSALSFAFLMVLSPSLHHLGLGLLFPSPLAATFPRTFQPGGWGPLVVDPPRALLPGAANHLSAAPVVVAAPSCSAPDAPVQGVCPPRLPPLSCRGCGGFCCLFPPGCSSPRRLAALFPRIIQPGVRRLVLLDPPRMIQSVAFGRRLSSDVPVRGAAAPVFWFVSWELE